MESKVNPVTDKNRVKVRRKNLPARFLTLGIVLVMLFSLTNFSISSASFPAYRTMPADVDAANQNYNLRRDTLLEYYVQETMNEPINGNPFGSFIDNGTKQSFRRMAAYLVNYKKQYLNQGDYSLASTVPAATPQDVDNWLSGVVKHVRAGTDLGNGNGDYDMYMKEMVTFLYLFKDNPQLLTNDAAYKIINQGLVYTGNDTDRFMGVQFKVLFWTYTLPETENHLLMTLSSVWLTNQWIYNNPRNDPRLRQGNYANTSNFLNSAAFEDRLLQVINRTVYSDLFETSARNYQAFSIQSLLNLYCFADNTKIKTAAKNALDYLAAKYAFQSLEGKRFAPNRRNYEYKDRAGIYDNDSTVFMMAMLSGAYVWDDTFIDWNTSKDSYFFGQYTQGGGHALWTALLMDQNLLGNRAYSLPPQIHDFMLDKGSGYTARIQARYTDNNYMIHHYPRYFNSDGTLYTLGNFEPAPEYYFVTNDYMNVMGGKENYYPILSNYSFLTSMAHNYDFLSRPNAVVTKGHIRDWGSGSGSTNLMKEDLLCQSSDFSSWWVAKNLGTYKNFSYGYAPASSSPVINIPVSWNAAPQQVFTPLASNGTTPIQYKIYDLRTTDNFYAVVGTLTYNVNVSGTNVARAFWEIIPGGSFSTLDDLRNYVLANNPADNFISGLTEYSYKLKSQETAILANNGGYSSATPILRIYDENNVQLVNKDYYVDMGNAVNMPLIDVRAVDSNYEYTGVKYAYSTGNGKIQIFNPKSFPGHLNYLCIDSSDYKNPAQYESSVPFINTAP
jgi:hypothetical protein